MTSHHSGAVSAVSPIIIPREYWGLAPQDLSFLLPPHLRLDVAFVPEGVLLDGVCLACAGRVARFANDSGRVVAPRVEGVSRYAISFGHESTYLEASVRATAADLAASHLECGAHSLEPEFPDDALAALHESVCIRAAASLRNGHALASTLMVLFEARDETPLVLEWSLDGLPTTHGQSSADFMALSCAYAELASRVRQECQSQSYPVTGAVALFSERRYAFPSWGVAARRGEGFLCALLSADYAVADIFTGISTRGPRRSADWAKSVVPVPLIRSLFAGVGAASHQR